MSGVQVILFSLMEHLVTNLKENLDIPLVTCSTSSALKCFFPVYGVHYHLNFDF